MLAWIVMVFIYGGFAVLCLVVLARLARRTRESAVEIAALYREREKLQVSPAQLQVAKMEALAPQQGKSPTIKQPEPVYVSLRRGEAGQDETRLGHGRAPQEQPSELTGRFESPKNIVEERRAAYATESAGALRGEQMSGTQGVPRALVLQARNIRDPYYGTLALQALLAHPEALSIDVEVGGDIARQEFRDYPLARQLYEKAVALDPQNISARAELLHLLASDPKQRDRAREEIFTLAEEHPNNRNVISQLLNFLDEVDDYETMAQKCEELLSVSLQKSYLWRNLAIARKYLRAPKEQVLDAFRNALAEAEDVDMKNNVMRPYAQYLLSIQYLDDAAKVIQEGILTQPQNAAYYLLLSEVHFQKRDFTRARRGLELARDYGNLDGKAQAGQRLAELGALESASDLFPTLSQ